MDVAGTTLYQYDWRNHLTDTASPLLAGEGQGEGPGNGSDGAYDRQAQQVQLKDQNATVHDYLFDRLGRMTEDYASTLGVDVDDLGTDVDGAVRKIH